MMQLENAGLALAALLVALLLVCSQEAWADGRTAGPAQGGYQIPNTPLDRLKQRISAIAGGHPGLYDPDDLNNFFNDQGTTSAARFLNQRSQNSRRASHLAQEILKSRRSLSLGHLEASQFPCELFKLGLIFEQGHSHKRNGHDEYVETSPVIWIRLGALGSIIKRLERLSPARLISAASKAPRNGVHRVRQAIRHPRRLRSQSARGDRKLARQESLITNLSTRRNEGLQQVLISIAWWLEDWARAHPNTKATLVLDFENTDFAFASWSVGEFFVRLDDMFPDLFEHILGFRFKPKLYSLHSPISMFNRIFKSRFASSPETDSKLKFIKLDELSAFMPRVDSNGFTMLPEHVSGVCVAPDEAKAPAGCQASMIDGEGLQSANFWRAVRNEFYQTCQAKARVH